MCNVNLVKSLQCITVVVKRCLTKKKAFFSKNLLNETPQNSFPTAFYWMLGKTYLKSIKLPLEHSTSWKCSPHFVYIARTYWDFSFKFCSSDQVSIETFLRSLYVKFKTSAHAHIAITHYFILFTNFLTWYEF